MTIKSSANLNRRAVLIAAAGVAPALVFGQARAATLPPSAVGYQGAPKDGKQCDGCNLFIAPGSCKSVSGAISPKGWCKLWVKAG